MFLTEQTLRFCLREKEPNEWTGCQVNRSLSLRCVQYLSSHMDPFPSMHHHTQTCSSCPAADRKLVKGVSLIQDQDVNLPSHCPG